MSDELVGNLKGLKLFGDEFFDKITSPVSQSDFTATITVRSAPPLKFSVINYDQKVADILAVWAEQKVYVEQYVSDKLLIPFPQLPVGGGGIISTDKLLTYFESRIFPESREGLNDLLTYLGLSTYSPLSIIKRTNGVLFDDYIWLRFAGEEELRYEDVGSRVVPESWRRKKDSINK